MVFDRLPLLLWISENFQIVSTAASDRRHLSPFVVESGNSGKSLSCKSGIPYILTAQTKRVKGKSRMTSEFIQSHSSKKSVIDIKPQIYASEGLNVLPDCGPLTNAHI